MKPKPKPKLDPKPKPKPKSKSKPNILIVDDDEDIVRILSIFLESRGYACQSGVSGAQGAIEFDLSDFALVITDLNMPCGDGISLIERIRRTSEVPVIIVTAFRKEYADKVRYLRGVTVLSKPIDTEALLDLIMVELAMTGDKPGRAHPAGANRTTSTRSK